MTLSSLKDMTSEDIETKADTGQRAWIENVGPIDKPDTVVEIYRSYLPEYRVETEKGLVRKIYMRLLPLLVVIYLFNYLDRNSITQARLYGLQKDTHVDGAVYQTAMSIFSAGYIAIQLPSAMLMTKPWPSRFLPSCIIGWAIVSGLNSATNSPASLLTVRFFLDMIDSCWYTKRELGIRMALLICGILLSNSFAGLISAGILSGMQGVGRLAAWRWLLILEGLATVAMGIIAITFLLDYPATTKWLSEAERIVAQGRLAADAGSDDVWEKKTVRL